MNQEIIVVFLIVSFSLGLVLIMKKDSLPDRLRRPLAVMAVAMVAISFALMVYSFFLL